MKEAQSKYCFPRVNSESWVVSQLVAKLLLPFHLCLNNFQHAEKLCVRVPYPRAAHEPPTLIRDCFAEQPLKADAIYRLSHCCSKPEPGTNM